MTKLNKLKNILIGIISLLERNKKYHEYKKGVKMLTLSQIQKKEARDYYKANFGININLKYHRLLYSISGVFKKEYLPFDIYDKMLEFFSPWKFRKILDDKNYYSQLLFGFNLPKRVVGCQNGIYYEYIDSIKRQITTDRALELILNKTNLIIKPSVGTSAGIGVKRIIARDKKELEDLIRNYGNNFVVEERINNSNQLCSLNPSSCNTIRIITFRDRYFSNNDILYVSSFIRIGKKGKEIDNVSGGGVAAPINEMGIVTDSGCMLKKGRVEKTDSGVTIKGLRINNFGEMIDYVKKAHQCLPHFDIVGWDVTRDDEDNIVIIEFNPDPDLRLEQLIFNDTAILDQQKTILSPLFRKK